MTPHLPFGTLTNSLDIRLQIAQYILIFRIIWILKSSRIPKGDGPGFGEEIMWDGAASPEHPPSFCGDILPGRMAFIWFSDFSQYIFLLPWKTLSNFVSIFFPQSNLLYNLKNELQCASVPFRGVCRWWTDLEGEIEAFNFDINETKKMWGFSGKANYIGPLAIKGSERKPILRWMFLPTCIPWNYVLCVQPCV